ncbi:pyruvoyl-dependent arginine decarboxylase [Halobellus salinus]|uniref:arginine decarboxylase n=1 Tax=Halobellus salinus TaxID=931585 RepID=A0A830EDR0_9EURY|nr:pyruvoyl-dependent arginine decarboxylase [Halobellus salinus]GGJ15737.1 pyruvoyl-dependent arginine decarboxylase [Halobellus salinus]SMP33069.1 arginine decarboxylase [Halobellus salinus]
MNTIRVVRGVGRAETRMASYDAALAAANIHNYNLVSVSSVIPAAATVKDVKTASDLGPAGGRLTVVEARATTGGVGTVSAGLGWATGPGPGLFYEVAGEDPAAVRRRVEAGLETGRGLREWTFDDETVAVVTADADGGGYTTAVVVAVYGEAESIL